MFIVLIMNKRLVVKETMLLHQWGDEILNLLSNTLIRGKINFLHEEIRKIMFYR